MQNSNKIQCKGCEESKPQEEFYLIDGGLGIEGIENLRFEICKECMKKYNDENDKHKTGLYKYLDWQCVSCYFVAKNDKTASSIDNGILNTNSKRDTIKNMRYLLRKRNSFEHRSKQHKKIFGEIENVNTQVELKNILQKILQEDYQTFRQFKQAQGVRQ